MWTQKASIGAAVCIALLAGCSGSDGGSTSLTVSAAVVGTGGTVDKSSALVGRGSSTTFTFTPDSGFVLDQVTGCGGVLGRQRLYDSSGDQRLHGLRNVRKADARVSRVERQHIFTAGGPSQR